MKTDRSHTYEVRCEHCQASFAPGTRQCVHCGRKLRRWRAQAGVATSPAAVHLELETEPEEVEFKRRGALGSIFTTVTVGLAILVSLYRSCPRGSAAPRLAGRAGVSNGRWRAISPVRRRPR